MEGRIEMTGRRKEGVSNYWVTKRKIEDIVN